MEIGARYLGGIEELRASKEDGRLKFFLIHRALEARKENADLFARGTYMRLGWEGVDPRFVIAFARRHGEAWALIVPPLSPRLCRADAWEFEHGAMPVSYCPKIRQAFGRMPSPARRSGAGRRYS